MNFSEFVEIANPVAEVLPGFPESSGAIKLFFERVKRIEASRFHDLCNAAIDSFEFFPKPAWFLEQARNDLRPERLSGFQLPPAPIDGSGCPRHVREYMKLQAREGGRLFAELAQARRTVRSRLQAQGGGVQQHRIDADETVKAVLQKIDNWKHFDREKQQQMQTLKEALADQPVEDLEPLEFSYEFTIEGEEVEF